MNKDIDLLQYIDESYLNYSMYVILDRAIPHVGDGLKPVQRRILYAMDQLNLVHTAKYKKSARTVGDVLGKYHPHGDTSCYEAMVLMAQPFSFRYPLVDGQGNWGTQDDPKSFAAMRYTESKLSSFSPYLLDDLKYKPVDYKGNFDGTLKEPVILPAQLPFVLLNGASGIAVGIACDIPPHNIGEIIDATCLMIDDPNASLDEILEKVQGPDFPSASNIIASKKELRAVYELGYGKIKVRANYYIDQGDIVITDLPFKKSPEKVIESIASLVNGKAITVIDDIQDHSDKENPIRIVIKLKRGFSDDIEKVVSFLYSKAEGLEASIKINMNMLGLDGSPEVKPLKAILSEWIRFRTKTVRNKYEHERKRLSEAKHVIEGMLIAFLNLDEVIRIIREEDDPKRCLEAAFDLSEIQSQAILDTRLGKLAKLEEMEIRHKHDDLSKTLKKIDKILSSDKNIQAEIRSDLIEIKEKSDVSRRSPILDHEAASLVDVSESELAPSEPLRIVLSKNGFIRAGKGHTNNPMALSYKNGDGYLDFCDTKSNSAVALLSSDGRIFNVSPADIPGARGFGDPVTKWLSPTPNTHWVSLVDPTQCAKWLCSSLDGYGFIASGESLMTRNKKGKVVISKAMNPAPLIGVEEQTHCVVVTSERRVLAFELSELPELDKGKGVKLCSLKKGESIHSILLATHGQAIEARDVEERVALSIPFSNGWDRSLGDRAKSPKGLSALGKLKDLSRITFTSE